MADIFFFGAGEKSKFFLGDDCFRKRLLYAGINVLGILDNDAAKYGKRIGEYKILPPSVLKKSAWDYVVVSSGYASEMRAQLRKQFCIAEERIRNIDEFATNILIRAQYHENQMRNQDIKSRCHSFNPKSTVIYTAVTGNYDDLKQPLFTNDELRYVCFTDNKELHSDVWEVRYFDVPVDMEAKHKIREFKILPHKYFPDYDTSIWVDASCHILGDLREYMALYQDKSNVLFFPHRDRNCIYDEGAECILLRKAKKELLIRQMAHYLNQGYPKENGLFWGGTIVRNHNDKDVINIMEDWWEEICNFSKRDQISGPYVFWKDGGHYDLSNIFYYDNRWLKVYPHHGQG